MPGETQPDELMCRTLKEQEENPSRRAHLANKDEWCRDIIHHDIQMHVFQSSHREPYMAKLKSLIVALIWP